MRYLSSRRRAVAAVAVAGLGALLWTGCIDQSQDSILGPDPGLMGLQVSPEIEGAITAQQRHTPALLAMSGVVGTAVARSPDGDPRVLLYLESPGAAGVYPSQVDGIPVELVVSGRLMAIADRTAKERPAPIGFSVGHPSITAGTFGTRVKNAVGDVFILSNNHVLAASNDAQIGDPTLQPGAFDGGGPGDEIGTLAAFQPIDFSASGFNVIDAAITATTVAQAGNATPPDEGYGTPNSRIFGDANGDGIFDDEGDLLGLPVQKYGRTTGHTRGTITAINGTFEICYEVVWIFCTQSAVFTDQLVIGVSGFSDGGDSGSLIVTDDENKHPVALLFAGSETQTIANRIDHALNAFDVTVDGEGAEPPAPVTDVAITDVSAPASVVTGDVVDVAVTVQNVGTEDVGALDVTVGESPDGGDLGTQSVASLAAGAETTLTFSWSSAGASAGDHTFTASHDLADDDGGNDSGSAVVDVGPAVTDIAVTSVSAPATATQGEAVSVDVAVQNVGNQDVGAFDVSVSESPDGDGLGIQNVAGLAAGAQTTLTFTWTTDAETSLGAHTLTGSHTLSDENAGNDQASTNVTVEEPSTGIHVGDLDGTASNDGSTWSATVEVTIHDGDHNPVQQVYVAGDWSPDSFLVSDECTTGELGGIGSCIMLYPSIRKRTKSVSFTVTTVSKSGETYDPDSNHDVDGDSDGTTITVDKP